MNSTMQKLFIAIGLYQPMTLLAKYLEICYYNPRRYFHRRIKSLPVSLMPGPVLTNNQLSHPDQPIRAGKTIYYLVHCFYPFSQGGTERFIYNTALQAQKAGHRVKIITYNAVRFRGYFKQQFAGILYNEYQIDGLDVVEYRHRRAPRGTLKDIVTDDPAVKAFAAFLFQQDPPDLVHVGYIQKVSSLIMACQEMQVPYILTLTSFYALCHFDIMVDQQGEFCQGCDGGAKCGRICRCLEIGDSIQRYQRAAAMLQGAATITAPSLFVQQMVEREFPGIKVTVNNHGVSAAFSHQEAPPALPVGSRKNFAYFGSISPIKGIHLLIQSFRDLPPEYTLNIYGSGGDAYLRQLKQLAAANPRIVFHGGVKFDAMAQAYAANEVVVVPSIWYETYNFVLHEAMLMQKWVIAARIGAMPERIVEGVNGWTFIPGDCQDLQRVIKLAAQESVKHYPRTSIQTLPGEFAVYDQLYESAANGSGADRCSSCRE